MDFALPTLMVICLLLPGLALRRTYERGIGYSVESPVGYGSLPDELLASLLFTAVLHLILYVPVTWLMNLTRFPLDGELICEVLLGSLKLANHPTPVLLSGAVGFAIYTLATTVMGAILGWLARYVVLEHRLDLLEPKLRLRSDWYYLLRGEIAELVLYDQEAGLQEVDPDHVIVSAVVNQGAKTYLYKGVLAEFYLNKDGGLDRLLLRSVYRRTLDNDKADDSETPEQERERYYRIDGDFFVLRAAEVCTLNVKYKYLVLE